MSFWREILNVLAGREDLAAPAKVKLSFVRYVHIWIANVGPHLGC
jgi:hypothetical protein